MWFIFMGKRINEYFLTRTFKNWIIIFTQKFSDLQYNKFHLHCISTVPLNATVATVWMHLYYSKLHVGYLLLYTWSLVCLCVFKFEYCLSNKGGSCLQLGNHKIAWFELYSIVSEVPQSFEWIIGLDYLPSWNSLPFNSVVNGNYFDFVHENNIPEGIS